MKTFIFFFPTAMLPSFKFWNDSFFCIDDLERSDGDNWK